MLQIKLYKMLKYEMHFSTLHGFGGSTESVALRLQTKNTLHTRRDACCCFQ